MKLNLEHSILRRVSPDTRVALEKLIKEEAYANALKELFSVALHDTHVDLDAHNWALKRSRLDGQEAILKTLASLIKD